MSFRPLVHSYVGSLRVRARCSCSSVLAHALMLSLRLRSRSLPCISLGCSPYPIGCVHASPLVSIGISPLPPAALLLARALLMLGPLAPSPSVAPLAAAAWLPGCSPLPPAPALLPSALFWWHRLQHNLAVLTYARLCPRVEACSRRSATTSVHRSRRVDAQRATSDTNAARCCCVTADAFSGTGCQEMS